MEGWLREFENRGLITRDGDGTPSRPNPTEPT
jgi:hypothetical protein